MNRQILSNSILKFSHLSDDDLSVLMAAASYKEYPKGAPVLKEGEVCRLLYFVEEGFLRTYYNKEGATINLDFTMEGDFTTNLKSAKSKQASEVTIEAAEDVCLWIFEVDKFESNFRRYPEVERFLRTLFVRLLLVSEEYSNLYKISTPTERYKYVEQNKPILLQRISLSQMASYIGVSRETLSRIRAKNSDNSL
jgi:CRP-like cAMP-binding protein